jgi:hypothetical protein
MHFTASLNVTQPARLLIRARALLVGPDMSYQVCIGQTDFENGCIAMFDVQVSLWMACSGSFH